MAALISFTYLLISISSLFLQVHTICDDSNEALADVCSRLYGQMEGSLFADEGNVYRIRKAFFYAPYANPVLLKVIYNITFAENVTESARLENNYCHTDIPTNANELQTTKFVNSSRNKTLGWTSSGVFTVFHPLTLNFMQIQIPFVLMRVMYEIFLKVDPTESGPEARSLLWDGGYDLPTLRINLHFNTVACIPTDELFNSVLSDLNSLLRIEAGRKSMGVIRDSSNTHLVGFTLPESKVIVPKDVMVCSDFWFYVAYVLSTIILYVTCVTAIFFLSSKTKEKGIQSSFVIKHPEVLKGVMIVVIVFIALEILTELSMSIVWANYSKDEDAKAMVFVAALIYYIPGVFSLGKIIEKCYLLRSGHYKDHKYPNGDAYFKCFVWTLAYFGYILMYGFFPAFVLSFAYPTRIITSFIFVATFMIFSIVYLTTFLKRGFTMKICERYIERYHWPLFPLKISVFIVMTVILLYFFLFIFALLYSLIIGRASVVSSAPLAILSLLPSILISIIAWIMKSTLLDTTNENDISQMITSNEEQSMNANDGDSDGDDGDSDDGGHGDGGDGDGDGGHGDGGDGHGDGGDGDGDGGHGDGGDGHGDGGDGDGDGEYIYQNVAAVDEHQEVDPNAVELQNNTSITIEMHNMAGTTNGDQCLPEIRARK